MTRIVRITAGFVLVLAGTAMLALPGPGILTIVAGLALLARDVVWARRLKDWVTRRFVEQPETEAEPDRV